MGNYRGRYQEVNRAVRRAASWARAPIYATCAERIWPSWRVDAGGNRRGGRSWRDNERDTHDVAASTGGPELDQMDRKQKTDPRNARPDNREIYETPKLKVFGPVGALTQAGSGTTSEAMSNGMASMSRNQRA